MTAPAMSVKGDPATWARVGDTIRVTRLKPYGREFDFVVESVDRLGFAINRTDCRGKGNGCFYGEYPGDYAVVIRAEQPAAIAAHVAPPVSASVEAALAALDVEETLHPDRMLVTHAILGLDDVRAAHRAEVEALRKELDEARGRARTNYLNILEVAALAQTGTGPAKYADPVLEDAAADVRPLLQERAAHAEAVRVAVEAERVRCMADCDTVKERIPADAHDETSYAFRGGADACRAAIRARGVKS